ncbi:putative signal transducing protein [Dinghuibacter silviterrae]|uniref:Putative signal transducing protein n=1 Tax=Dinghuibacter silviterrae TaxID=1539049 RepID=A0A4R8DQU3_9BACT|nr:DUF2007 domain-containing protein [Dinghuibacter silviterrae]TDW99686.1 putative signal transducing protein [Dinghuibacter silviterrae]
MLVVLRTYGDYISANVVLGRLKEAGIHAFLQDEYGTTTLAYSSSGIKLVVPEEEARTASAMLGIMEDEASAATTEEE